MINVIEYRGYKIKKVKGKRPYECEELQLMANTLDFLDAQRRLFQFSVNQVEGEIISNTLKELKQNHNLKNNKEALLFLIDLYRVK